MTYGYAIYQAQTLIASGSGSLNPQSHVFDAEAVGAWRGLQHAMRLDPTSYQRIEMCIDSTSVIWCLRGNAPISSQWAFLNCQQVMEACNVQVRWSPGHTGIIGNEMADTLADDEAKNPSRPMGAANEPTASGVRSVAKTLLKSARQNWWAIREVKLSSWYKQWELPYQTTKTPPELGLSRPILARLLAIRSKHGDFAWYHTKFNHDDATLECTCGRPKTPEHIVHCRKTRALFNKWPLRPLWPPSDSREGICYLAELLSNPSDFEALLEVTNFYAAICKR